MREDLDAGALGALLLLGLLGLGWRAARAPEPDLLGPDGPPALVPDLARDGVERLGLLPGIGAERARGIVRERPGLGTTLTPQNLALLPGVGEETAAAVRAFYARLERAAAASEAEAVPQR